MSAATDLPDRRKLWELQAEVEAGIAWLNEHAHTADTKED